MNRENPFRRRASALHPLAIALATACTVCAGADPAVPAATWAEPHGAVGVADAAAPASYIVRFEEAPVAGYGAAVSADPAKAVAGIAAIPTRRSSNGRMRLDVASAPARNYARWVEARQDTHLADIAAALGTAVVPRRRFVHALNAVVVDLDEAQAAVVGRLPGVAAVRRERHASPATDIGPGFIGAAPVWWGAPAAQDTLFASGFERVAGTFGDGIVIGVIDSGYNSSSPSFQPLGIDGAAISNPLGAGNYLGQCAVPGISDAGCNDKVIGVYDEIDDGTTSAPYSVEDVQAHGSHTASTALGAARSSPFGGARLSGVAPHANLVVYYACAPAPVYCPESATVGSVDSAVADGVVDVLNYSLTGGTSPWDDATSQAFLGATEAGIFVAAAAGNTGAGVLQLPGLANHLEPWTTTVAAGTHTGAGAFSTFLQVSGPGEVPPAIAAIQLTEAVPGTDASPTGSLPPTTPIVLSPQFDVADTSGSDGCSGYESGTFAGAIALVSRGSCPFATKLANAVAAGAIGAVIVDNQTEGPFIPDLSAGPTTVPVFMATRAAGGALADFLGAQPGRAGTAGIPFPYTRLATAPDVLGSFSLIGPAPGIAVIKPDVQAPGVRILAAINNRNLPDGNGDPRPPNGADAAGMLDGTSMATPHVAGAAALLMAVHPEWTPPEIKSALMMTAQEAGLTKANGATPSDAFDRGGGRIRVDFAARAGLVLDENGANFQAADPAAGGDPATLNLASVQDLACGNARHVLREFTSALGRSMQWNAAVGGDLAGAVALDEPSFEVGAGKRHAFGLTLNCAALPADGVARFGELVLTPADATLPALHLPIAAAVPKPSIEATPAPVAIALGGAPAAGAGLSVANGGGGMLDVAAATAPYAPYVWADHAVENDGTIVGYGSTRFTDLPASASNQYSADDFTITGFAPVDLARIVVTGHSFHGRMSSFGPGLPLHWRIYADAAGAPAGDPDDDGVAPVWAFDAATGDPGVSVADLPNLSGLTLDVLSLDLVAAGQHTALPPGRYWLTVYPSLPCNALSPTTCDGWYFDGSTEGDGAAPMQIAPQGSDAWNAISSAPGLAMHVESSASCTVPAWLGFSGLPLDLGPFGRGDVQVVANAGGLGGADATGYLCLDSNDAAKPVLPVQVNARP